MRYAVGTGRDPFPGRAAHAATAFNNVMLFRLAEATPQFSQILTGPASQPGQYVEPLSRLP
jgi:hypothetical protein